MYPTNSLAGKQIRRIKIASCQRCNQSFQADEAHARAILSTAGLNMTPERREIWDTVMRGIRRRGRAGRRDGLNILAQLEDGSILKPDGRPFRKIYPLKDPRVVHIIKKIVRGLCYWKSHEVIADENRIVLRPATKEPGLDKVPDKIFDVPNVFSASALFSDGPSDVHSVWFLNFYDNVFVGAFILPSDSPAAT
jgi:hypothetical protein